MNDIEQLISRLPRPSPSPILDERIEETLNSTASAECVERRPRHPRRSIAFIGTAVCAGFIGFALGRHSVPSPEDVHRTMTQPAVPAVEPDSTPAPEPEIVIAQDGEALARFVMPRQPFVRLFGNGPLEEQEVSNPLE